MSSVMYSSWVILILPVLTLSHNGSNPEQYIGQGGFGEEMPDPLSEWPGLERIDTNRLHYRYINDVISRISEHLRVIVRLVRITDPGSWNDTVPGLLQHSDILIVPVDAVSGIPTLSEEFHTTRFTVPALTVLLTKWFKNKLVALETLDDVLNTNFYAGTIRDSVAYKLLAGDVNNDLWVLMKTNNPITFVDHLFEGLTKLLTQKYALVLDVPRAERIAASYKDRVYTLIPFLEQKTYLIIQRHDVTSAQQLNLTMATVLNEVSTLRGFDAESVREVFSNIPVYANVNTNRNSNSITNTNINSNGSVRVKQSMESTPHTPDSIQLSNTNDPDSQTPDEGNGSDNDNDNELTVDGVMDGAALTSGAVDPSGDVIHSALYMCVVVVLSLCVVYL